MKCVDGEYLEIFGNYDSDRTSNLMVVFEKCNNKTHTCKNDTEIEAWMKSKYIVTLEN